MKKVVVAYPCRTKLLCMTGTHLYSFPLRSSFWSTLNETPFIAIERLAKEADELTRGFTLHESGRKYGDDEYALLVLVPLPFCSTVFKKIMAGEEPPENAYIIPPVMGATSYYATKKYQGEEFTLVIHTEHRTTAFVVLRNREPVQFRVADRDKAHRTLRTLEHYANDRNTVVVFSGERNTLVANSVNPGKVVEVSDEEVVKGAYLGIALPLICGDVGGSGARFKVDMGEEE